MRAAGDKPVRSGSARLQIASLGQLQTRMNPLQRLAPLPTRYIIRSPAAPSAAGIQLRQGADSMRSTLRMAAAVAALTVTSAVAGAQSSVTSSIGLGATIPLGELAEEANTGINLVGSLGFKPAMLPVGLRADLLWQQYSGKEEGTFRELGALANAVLDIGGLPARPYLVGTAGLIRRTTPEENRPGHVHPAETENYTALGGGAGVRFALGPFASSLEARWLATGDGHGAFPITLSIRF
jgi:hypothetical protein